jgi:aryl-alcohol dehydrogenase-like predicted oxidoreductase
MSRTLGANGSRVSALGMGCWAIGGPHSRGGAPVGWGAVDDEESVRALRRAFELGVNFYDTADVYGCGHSERLIARALGANRGEIMIATKFGYTYDEDTRQAPGTNANPDYIRSACDASLRRLDTDYIDLYQFHLGGHDLDQAREVLSVLEELVDVGKVRTIGWSTDDVERARVIAESPHCVAIQQAFNVFDGNAELLTFCEQRGLASVARGPLAMGFLTGKYSAQSSFPPDDVRHSFSSSETTAVLADRMRGLESIREILRADGRTLAQGAIAWLWARSPVLLPIPGFRSVEQVEENASALNFGPLNERHMQEIDALLSGH